MTDPIADLLIRIKNAYMAKHEELTVPTSKIKAEIVKILVENKYLSSYSMVEQKPQGLIKIKLNYINRIPAMSGIKRVSKCGCRRYSDVKHFKRVLGGYGLAILSTNKGVITSHQARKLNVGGELLCEIW
jgi:small subunit ribosomal protein S8